MAKQPVTVEIAYGGTWHTAPPRAADQITTVRGRGNETSEPVPSTARLTLDDRSRIYNPRNPLSPLYGLAGRYTPIRIGLPVITKTFDTTVVNGWGAEWSLFGGGGTPQASDFQVASGTARHRVPVDNAYRASYLTATSYRDVDVTFQLDMFTSDVTGAAVEPGNVMLRGQSQTDYYLARLAVSAAEVVTLELFHTVAGSLAGPVTLTNITWTAQPLRIRAQVDGQIIRAKAWDAAVGGEPYGWQVTAVDDTITAPGWLGIRSGLAAGNTNTKPVEFFYDDLVVTLPRFAGEISSWQPRRTEDFDPVTGRGDAWSVVQAAGTLARLGEGATPLRSPLYRATPGTDPIAWWPLEEGRNAAQAASGLLGGAPLSVDTGLISFSTDGPPGAAGSAAPTAENAMHGPVPAGSSIRWQASIWERSEPIDADAPGGGFWIALHIDTTSHLWRVFPEHPLGGLTQVASVYVFDYANPFSAVDTLDATTANSPRTMDGRWHLIQVDVQEVAGSAQVRLWVDGVQRVSDTFVGIPAGMITGIRCLGTSASGTMNNAKNIAVSGITIHNAAAMPDLYTPGTGHAGETAAARLARLAAEQGETITVLAGDTAPMGPQGVDTFVGLLREIERTDDGLLYEPRGDTGLVYRPRASMYNQSPALALDFAAAEVVPPLQPALDNQGVRNDVTAQRRDGSAARSVLESGPLSVQPPPAGIGRVDTRVDVNPAGDAALPNLARWYRGKFTQDATRYPRVSVNLDANPALAGPASDVDIGDVLTVDNTEEGGASLRVLGYTETTGSHRRAITYNAAPADPYAAVGVYDVARYDTAGSQLNGAHTATTTNLSVKTTSGPVWTTTDEPFDIDVGGEQITVTSVVGASSPQTMQVTRSVNGVVKAHADNTPVRLWRPNVYAL